MSPDRVTVVLPTYNELDNLRDVAAAVVAHGYHLLIVDDGSPDGTGELADELTQGNELIAVLHRQEKQGLGPAYAAGFDRVLAGEGDVVIEMDADFSHDPADLPRLVEAVANGADLAIGSRYVPGGATEGWSAIRKWVSKAGNLYARVMLGVPAKDITAGFRAFSQEALARLPYKTAEATGYGFQVEMAWRAHEAGFTTVEVPVIFRDRQKGTSKMGPAIVAEAMWLVTVWGLGRMVRQIRSRTR